MHWGGVDAGAHEHRRYMGVHVWRDTRRIGVTPQHMRGVHLLVTRRGLLEHRRLLLVHLLLYRRRGRCLVVVGVDGCLVDGVAAVLRYG